jgi:sorting nexin-29
MVISFCILKPTRYTNLEKVIRDAALNIRGNIFYKSVQILAYADDIDIIGRTQSAMIEAFNSLEKAAKDMNLLIRKKLNICQ